MLIKTYIALCFLQLHFVLMNINCLTVAGWPLMCQYCNSDIDPDKHFICFQYFTKILSLNIIHISANACWETLETWIL